MKNAFIIYSKLLTTALAYQFLDINESLSKAII